GGSVRSSLGDAMGIGTLVRRFARFHSRAAVAAGSRVYAERLEVRALLSVNPIVAENKLPGTPQSVWDVALAGDPTILGYSTDISANVGETVYFKIDDQAQVPYSIDIYRMGYYGGLGARKVASIPSSQTL